MKKNLLLVFLIALGSNLLVSQNTLYYNAVPGTVDYLNSNNSALKVADGNSTIATSYTNTVCGLNYTQGSVFLSQRNVTVWPWASAQPAPIVISSIPPVGCYTILKAFLYVSANGSGVPITATLTNPQNATASFSMAVIGQGMNTCWNYPASYSYRADVTSIVTGNGTYSVSGIPVAPTATTQPDDAHGATLLIIYRDNTQTYSGSIVIADGNAAIQGGTKVCNIGGFNVCGPTNSTTNFMLIADLQGQYNSNIAFNNPSTNYTLTTSVQKAYNWVSDPGTPAAVGQTTANYSASGGSDCFAIILAGMYFRTSCLTCTLAPNTPSVSVATSSNPICTGNQATLSASGAGSYTWNTASNNSSIVVSPSVNTTYIVWSSNANGCASASLTQTVSICNGLNEIAASQQIKIYPNPSKGNFKVELKEKLDQSEIVIYNSIGQLIDKQKLKEGINYIDISKFSSGYYYAVITSNGKSVHQEKLIVE